MRSSVTETDLILPLSKPIATVKFCALESHPGRFVLHLHSRSFTNSRTHNGD